MRTSRFFSILLLAPISFLQAQSPSGDIRLNQAGFYPAAPKMAVVTGQTFMVRRAGDMAVVFRGAAGAAQRSAYSGRESRVADFSALQDTGSFVLEVPGAGTSGVFVIRPAVHAPLVVAALKGFYYQRTATELTKAYAGPWSRPAGHPDTAVLVHPSAAGPKRVSGTVISSPGGWYDAGDYNKYIVNCGITMGTLLSLYEDHPAYCRQLRTGIPESGNALPDLLDEILFNLRWMLTMQDPDDGGVYHKLTNAAFDGTVMPHEARKPRYVVQKSTAAALDFAAVTAQAARVFASFPDELPGLADSCVQAAERAWQWAVQHPEIYYDQQKINRHSDPDISTGGYGDRNVRDEFAWAGAELFITTKKEQYRPEMPMPLQIPTWSQVRWLGCYRVLRSGYATDSLKRELEQWAGDRVKQAAQNPYRTVMGASARDFVWGSNAVAANQGIALLYAYRISGNKSYLHHALANLDYLLGRNATGYSFVTGIGTRTPMHPHHRPSQADGITAPVPGLLAGGPNPGRQDGCKYPSAAADEAYTDDDCSYASNEIAINWNAPLVYLAAALEALEEEF
ncbi:glycoside hydrolase family 9 protein [Chitinophaga sp. XS-30]|uniref:glycoside hydrolase family 9 protein n=1 Tax=Chitinophaga sp. XS-30 TaxID=2604421 RepID=UPI0011DDD940|nr:glycoside hydrolase family 9 protein [Chitinophaga sp. XS-30]QEH42999.1 cellulase [Chitinophaga sp. XS-30]